MLGPYHKYLFYQQHLVLLKRKHRPHLKIDNPEQKSNAPNQERKQSHKEIKQLHTLASISPIVWGINTWPNF